MGPLETFSIAVNVLAVSQAAAKVAKLVFVYIKSARNYPETAKKLHDELNIATSVLSGLITVGRQLDEAASHCNDTPPEVSRLNEDLKKCQELLVRLIVGLERNHRHWWDKLKKRTKWPLEEREVMESIRMLERYRNSFVQMLQIDIAKLVMENHEEVLKISENVEDIQEEVEGVRKNLMVIAGEVEETNTKVTMVARNVEEIDTNVRTIEMDLGKVDGNVMAIQSEVQQVHTELTTVGADIQEINTDTKQMVTNVDKVTTDIQHVGRDIQAVKIDINRVQGCVMEIGTVTTTVTNKLDLIHEQEIQEIRDRQIEAKKKRLAKLTKWLAPSLSDEKHEQSVEAHQDGTGKWLFEHRKYLAWRNNHFSSLWIHGTPGCGKTILASCVIQSFLAVPDESFSYFYFQYRSEDKTATVLCKLLAQLLNCCGHSVLEHPDFAELERTKTRGVKAPIDVNRLTELLFVAFGLQCRSPTIVLDGLDEHPEKQLHQVLKFIQEVRNRRSARILVFSRQEKDIENALKDFPFISLRNEKVNLKKDMRIMIEKEFSDEMKWDGIFQSLKSEITEQLLLRSGVNTFQWLKCQLDLLNRLGTVMEVTDALNRLPRTLFESYDRMLAHIAENHYEALIRKAFFFIFHARMPLSLKMLVEAIAPVDENNQIIFDATFFDPEKLVKICRSLLYLVKTPSGRNRYDAIVRENQEGVTFCHLTVKEYLMSEHLRDHPTLSKFYIRKDDTLMAKKILEYLLLQDFNGPCTSKADAESRLKKHTFYRYCALSWFDHLLDAEEEDPSLFELIDKFVFSSPGHLRTYEQILEVWWGSNKCEVSMSDRDKLQYYYRKDTELDTDLSGALLFFFISSGPEWISKLFCNRKPNLLNTNSCRFGPPLWIAIQWHREDLARHFIEKGADIQMMCPTERPPLFATATSTMMSGLYFDPLLKCATLPACNFRPTPMPASTTSFIHVAAQHTPKLLPKLLDEGLLIDTRAEDGSTPLHLAVMNGDLSTVKMLVESGANINARTHGERTPFHIAISTQSAPIIKYFLENNVAIPPDIIATDVEMVARNVGLNEKCIDSAYYISNKTQLFPSIRSTLAHNRKDVKCLQTAVSNGPGRHGAMELDNPYLYFTFEGSVLRRIEFKLHSKEILSDSRRRDTVMRTDRLHAHLFNNCYSWQRSWFDVAIIKSSRKTATFIQQTDRASRRRRFIQSNVNFLDNIQYHSVVWDDTDPTPGVREWLKAVENGDTIVVYARAVKGWGNVVDRVEVDAYTDSNE